MAFRKLPAPDKQKRDLSHIVINVAIFYPNMYSTYAYGMHLLDVDVPEISLRINFSCNINQENKVSLLFIRQIL